jgi:hypothetical protein
VTQLDSVTQANAANAEESASASEELAAQAAQMNDVVNELSKLVGGTTRTLVRHNVTRQAPTAGTPASHLPADIIPLTDKGGKASDFAEFNKAA